MCKEKIFVIVSFAFDLWTQSRLVINYLHIRRVFIPFDSHPLLLIALEKTLKRTVFKPPTFNFLTVSSPTAR